MTSGTATLKDAMNDALRDWVTNVDSTFYIIGTAAGPHPYPELVRDFQSVIGVEAKEQMDEAEGRLPDVIMACIGGGSNAIGLFHPFLDDKDVEIIGVEAAGHGVDTDKHAASLTGGRPGVLHGNRTYLLQNDDGQITDAHSISAGLDYPGIGPEHAWLHETGRVNYVSATDTEALDAFQLCAQLEGIIPALEPAHALARAVEKAGQMDRDQILLMNMCGRGDKDIFCVMDALGAGVVTSDSDFCCFVQNNAMQESLIVVTASGVSAQRSLISAASQFPQLTQEMSWKATAEMIHGTPLLSSSRPENTGNAVAAKKINRVISVSISRG